MAQPRLSRRTILKAGAVSLSLPMLESMLPARATAAAESKRMLNICCTLGLYTPSWLPETNGPDYEATEYLSILDHHRSNYTVLSGLSHEEQSGRQPHNSEITWLTAQRKPGTDGFRNTISLDQVAATNLGYTTRFPSQTFGTTSPQSQSYTATGVMIPAETSPARAFDTMFLQGTPEEIARERARLRDGASVLDYLMDKKEHLRPNISAEDSHTVDAYFQAVREAELQLAEIQDWADRPKPMVDTEQPVDLDSSRELIGRIRLWFDMIPLILETDSTRVINLMIQDHSVVPNIAGVSNDQHGLSHHGLDERRINQLRIVEREIVNAFSDLLDALDERRDAGGSLLDQTAVLFGSNLGNANSHSTRHLPLLLAGGGFAHGEHVAFGEGAANAPLSNLFVTLLQRMGVETESFGQSDGALTW